MKKNGESGRGKGYFLLFPWNRNKISPSSAASNAPSPSAITLELDGLCTVSCQSVSQQPLGTLQDTTRTYYTSNRRGSYKNWVCPGSCPVQGFMTINDPTANEPLSIWWKLQRKIIFLPLLLLHGSEVVRDQLVGLSEWASQQYVTFNWLSLASSLLTWSTDFDSDS